MALTPDEIRHVSIRRRVRGYGKRETERLLAEIADSYQSVWNQRAELVRDLNQLQAELDEAQQSERLRSAEQTDLVARLEQGEAELARLQKKSERLETDRGAQRAEVQHAHAELDGLRSDIERLKAERNLEREERQRATEELTGLREEVAQLRADRGRSAEDARRSTAELAELREEVARLEAERGRLANDSQGSSAELADLREEVARIEAERGRLTEESQESSIELADLREEVARLEAERARVLQESARMRADLVELRRMEKGREAELADLRRDVVELLRLLEGETHARYRQLTAARDRPESEDETEVRSDSRPLSDFPRDVQTFERERARFRDQVQQVEEDLGIRDQVAERLWDLLTEHLRLLESEPRRAAQPDVAAPAIAQSKSRDETKPGNDQHDGESETQPARPDPGAHADKPTGDALNRGALGW
jgi:chromosome segregation ATPase